MPRIPIDLESGKIKEQNLIVGIDLGTTNSLIARIVDGQPEAIADYDRELIVPSLIHFGPGGGLEVGETVPQYLVEDPEHTIHSVKRLMGKSYADIADHAEFFSYRILDDGSDNLVKIEIDGRYYTPVELSSYILRELRQRAEHRLKTTIQQAVITVPAYFNDAQRQATRDAGKLAGLDVLRIINEPTAAALAYGLGLDPNERKTVAVYDLGGGTFDVSILSIEQGTFDVRSTHGDTYLGGDDFDRAVYEHWIRLAGLDPTLLKDRNFAQKLRLQAREAKKHLSTHDTYTDTFTTPDGNSHVAELTRATFDELIAPYIQQTIEACRHALKDADLQPGDLDAVILVGGSTRVPAVRKAVGQFFEQEPYDQLDPDQVVALGAAIQADILAGNRRDLLLLDVTPLSLGIETAGGLMDVLIPRNTRIPIRVARMYTTSVDGQVNMRISVFQGEREFVADNRRLGEFELRGIPAMPAALPKVEVTFILDADGILKVEAEEKRSGVRQEIAIQPKYGLSDAEVEQMLKDSMDHAETDVHSRMQQETINEGRQMVYFSEKFLHNNTHLFDDTARAEMVRLIQALSETIQTEDRETILAAQDALEAFSRPYAEQAMNQSIRQAMVGNNLEAYETEESPSDSPASS